MSKIASFLFFTTVFCSSFSNMRAGDDNLSIHHQETLNKIFKSDALDDLSESSESPNTLYTILNDLISKVNTLNEHIKSQNNVIEGLDKRISELKSLLEQKLKKRKDKKKKRKSLELKEQNNNDHVIRVQSAPEVKNLSGLKTRPRSKSILYKDDKNQFGES